MWPILSATNTYNYSLAKWLDDKLKPLSCNQYTVIDTFRFADEVRELEIKNGEILVSYDVTSLFTNVPLEETIQILAEKAFVQDWFNETHSLNLSKTDLIDLLRAATKNQLFQFDGDPETSANKSFLVFYMPVLLLRILAARAKARLSSRWWGERGNASLQTLRF